MALPMVHLETAAFAGEYLAIQNPPSYYLGAIAPDGVHMLEDYTSEVKSRSHLGTRSGGGTEPVAGFLGRLPEFSNRDYALGYAVHVLTDIQWKASVYAEFRRRYQADPAPALERSKAYYSDMDQIDLELYNTWEERKTVWQALELAQACELPGILPKRAAELWNRRTLDWYEAPRRFEMPLRYTTLQEVLDFMAAAGKDCAEFINRVLSEGGEDLS